MHKGETAGQSHDPAIRRGVKLLEDTSMRRGLVFGSIIVAAMLAFELFNYTTTDYALTNLLGDLRFFEIRWATILAIAFCAIDFAGIARLFTPERGKGEHVEVWYLLAAWFLAATMNAMLTWWGVSLALLTHSGLGNEILGRETLLAVVPVFVAILVWLIRILLIGLLAMAGERLFTFMEEAVRVADVSAAVLPGVPAAQARVALAPARLPTADWAGGSRSSPAPGKPARVIGSAADDAGRSNTVAERHGYGRFAQDNNRPARANQPPPLANTVRPAPKPSASTAHTNPAGGVRPVPARMSSGSGNGNGNGHNHNSDVDFDD